VSTTISSPRLETAGTTEAQLQQAVTRRVSGAAIARAENVGEPNCQSPKNVPLRNWGWRFLDEPLANQLQIQVVDDEYVDTSVLELRCPIPPDDYYIDRKPVQLLLKTNVGARLFTYSMPKPTQAEIDKLSLDAANEAVSRCKQLVDPWWQHSHRFNPRWHVDPPFRVSPADRQVWVFTFAGLQSGDTMTASVGERHVMSAHANARGSAMLSVMSSGATPAP
jgi:hypothetical protein